MSGALIAAAGAALLFVMASGGKSSPKTSETTSKDGPREQGMPLGRDDASKVATALGSNNAEVIRALAGEFRRRGLTTQADQLEATAVSLERMQSGGIDARSPGQPPVTSVSRSGAPAASPAVEVVTRRPGRFLKRGASGDGVRVLQTRLLALGYDLGRGGADGKFGPATESAVRAFQAAAGVTVDGVVGPETAAALAKVRDA